MKKSLIIFLCVVTEIATAHYQATWESLDSRPLPLWYDKAKVGIFIHFGVYSVPSFKSEWFWCYWKCPDRIQSDVVDFMSDNYPPNFSYQDFAKDLRLEFFNATQWVKLFERSGARYAVLTTKHHEGYTLWPSKSSFSWNSMDVGPRRDIVGEFSRAVRKSRKLHLGLYHSLFEWFNPLYLLDKESNFTTRNFVKGTAELYEIVKLYEPDLIWSDGDAGPDEYWQSKQFLAWLYNESPVKNKVVVNDRWGFNTSCKHGGYLNCADRYTPGTKLGRKWENAMTLDTQSWGYRRNGQLEDYLSAKQLLKTLAETVSKGGNLLVDVGPTKEGTIPVIMQERLLQMGAWLEVNGEAIYNTKPWLRFNDTTAHDVYYTSSSNGYNTFGIFLQWPSDDMIVLSAPAPTPATSIYLLGYPKALKWRTKGYTVIQLPSLSKVQHLKHAWTLKFTNMS